MCVGCCGWGVRIFFWDFDGFLVCFVLQGSSILRQVLTWFGGQKEKTEGDKQAEEQAQEDEQEQDQGTGAGAGK